MRTIIVIFLSICFIFSGNAQDKKGTTVKKDDAKKTVAVIKTNMGNIELQLFSNEAPKTVENFVTLAKKGYYKGILFHRVIKGFMIIIFFYCSTFFILCI